MIDVLVKSKYCKACEFCTKKKDTIKYEEWTNSHSEHCQANHLGSAEKMEVDAVIDMFLRSENLHSVKYKNYVGDGDNKTFKGILDATPHEDCTVQKKSVLIIYKSVWALGFEIKKKIRKVSEEKAN